MKAEYYCQIHLFSQHRYSQNKNAEVALQLEIASSAFRRLIAQTAEVDKPMLATSESRRKIQGRSNTGSANLIPVPSYKLTGINERNSP